MSRKSRQNEVAQQAAQAAQAKQNKVRIIIGSVLAVVLIALIIVGVRILAARDPGTVAGSQTAQDAQDIQDQALDLMEDVSDAVDDIVAEKNMDVTDFVVMEVEGFEDPFFIELYGNMAPITVENFQRLVNEGFYNGLTFHRIIDGFMIQGGDPNHNGTGGANADIKGEFSGNGVRNDIKHVRGTVPMARPAAPDSASSQSFLMHQDAPHLDGQYAAFGKVIRGMEIVDDICQKTPVTDSNGTVTFENQPVITSIERVKSADE